MSWSQIRGCDVNRAVFATAVRTGRLAHGYLFVGPEGVGKRTFARELAKSLLCERPGADLDACGNCTACLLFDGGTHADYAEFRRDPEKNVFEIEIIRDQVLTYMALKPARGNRKIVILEDADTLNAEAANCFLKTLEEPPPGSLLILLGGGSAETQLATIVSRCQVIRFTQLKPVDMRDLLAQNGIVDAAKVERLLRLANGSIGRALALGDDALWDFRGKMIRSFASTQEDSLDRSRDWMKFIDEAGTEAALKRQRTLLLLDMLMAVFRSALRTQMEPQANSSDPEATAIQAIGSRIGIDKLLKWIERIIQAETHVHRFVQLVLAVEALHDALR